MKRSHFGIDRLIYSLLWPAETRNLTKGILETSMHEEDDAGVGGQKSDRNRRGISK